jgi:hypothetical protein
MDKYFEETLFTNEQVCSFHDDVVIDNIPCNITYNTVLYLYYIVHDINCIILHYCTQYCTYICVISKYYIVHNIILDIS